MRDVIYSHFCIVKKSIFTTSLMQWHKTANDRQMPWKGERDPYKIWLSEVILQQTRVEQGWSYYEKFIKHYPTIDKLAKAKDEDAYKLWEGLGYYNRCKNLLFTAREIVQQHKGVFPSEYDNILALKGVGPYTAAAIASFAYDLPFAVVDGNVFRVLSRAFGVDTAIDSTAGKQYFATLAQEVLDLKEPGAYNQAIMDFGATVCKPALPHCAYCPLEKHCVARATGKVNALPVKEKVLQKKTRWFTYFIFENDGRLYIRKRGEKDIWENLYEFYLVETDEKPVWDTTTVAGWLDEQFRLTNATVGHITTGINQQLTHQTIKAQFILVHLKDKKFSLSGFDAVGRKELSKYAFPKLINMYLQEKANIVTLF